MKKLKSGGIELARVLIDKMLENHGVDYDYVMANQYIDGKVWCSHYEWTQEESDKYKEWYIDFLYNNVSPRMSKKYIKLGYSWWNLQYGLRIKDYEKT